MQGIHNRITHVRSNGIFCFFVLFDIFTDNTSMFVANYWKL